jgi:hypothetical protein
MESATQVTLVMVVCANYWRSSGKLMSSVI